MVLNFEHGDDTARCVAALRRSTHRDLSIIVTDNGSTEPTRRTLRAELDDRIRIIENGDNIGYAAGNNPGIVAALEAGTDFVWLVNPDVVVSRDTLAGMLDVARAHPDAGCIGSRIALGGTDPPRVWFDGGRIDWSLGGAASHVNSGAPLDRLAAQGARPVDYVTGANLLVRREVVEEIGLLPEDYFLYFEEADFQVRAARKGWRAMVDTDTVSWHHKRSAGRTPAPYYVYYYVRGRYLFASKFAPDLDPGAMADLEKWIADWRANVTDAAPHWLDTYDRLVELGRNDGTHSRTGRRDDIALFDPA